MKQRHKQRHKIRDELSCNWIRVGNVYGNNIVVCWSINNQVAFWRRGVTSEPCCIKHYPHLDKEFGDYECSWIVYKTVMR